MKIEEIEKFLDRTMNPNCNWVTLEDISKLKILIPMLLATVKSAEIATKTKWLTINEKIIALSDIGETIEDLKNLEWIKGPKE